MEKVKAWLRGVVAFTMFVMLAALVGIVLALASSPARADTWLDYWTFNAQRGGIGVVNGNPYNQWVTTGDGRIIWCEPFSCKQQNHEFMAQRNCAGADYVILEKLDTWPIRQIKATITDLQTGATFNLPDCNPGHIYMLAKVPSWPYRIRVWMDVVGQRAFWESDFYPPTGIQNDCWQDAGPSNLPAIRQTEVWWSANGGWVRGEGSPAFDAAGNPQVPTTVHRWEHVAAKGIGPAWKFGDAEIKGCLRYSWAW